LLRPKSVEISVNLCRGYCDFFIRQSVRRNTLKIASFNANGIRARLPILEKWLEKERPEILCVQETKVQDKDFPRRPFEDMGYHCSFKGQKSYNGVAILSSTKPQSWSDGFQDGDDKEGPRLITARFDNLAVVNTYIPQGREPDSEMFVYKLDWFERLKVYFGRNFTPAQNLVWTGDFNVAPTAIDVYDPEKLFGHVGYHPKEHDALKTVMDWGFEDIFRRHHPDTKAFTFWDYRLRGGLKRGLGWRIDHICTTAGLAAHSTACWIDTEPRQLERPSDHTFIVAEFDL
jgi:exodeoxyribonuclease III